ncbi:DivIVA domain-containing protein [Lentilactobacillus laojiaonis]|uniref:DivIVA domain-containing protein n=1 Tax=Lentilactobacillus laojiaonis TaxID=2883998 RepID=UPI001D0A0EC8|nr:DivIVA domain-containing protein [Lentilactobacillus laojiaonis]UDM32479.1 DivIVA domain-containing protein [Lentilactobacillus laojiaonis]
MVLSPQDIHNKKFTQKMRGYNIDEVNEFLDQIIKDYQIVLQENKDLSSKLHESEDKLKYFNDLKDSLNQSILVAQEAADKVKSNSQKEADIIIREANKESADIINSANEKAKKMIDETSKKSKKLAIETDDLRKNTRVFRQRLQVMLESQLEVIKGSDWDELLDDNSTISYSEIEKIVGDLDNSNNDSVKSKKESKKPEKNLEAVVIYPEGQK